MGALFWVHDSQIGSIAIPTMPQTSGKSKRSRRSHDDGGPPDPLCNNTIDHSMEITWLFASWWECGCPIVFFDFNHVKGTTVFNKSYTIEGCGFPPCYELLRGLWIECFTRCSCCRLGQGSLSLVYRPQRQTVVPILLGWTIGNES